MSSFFTSLTDRGVIKCHSRLFLQSQELLFSSLGLVMSWWLVASRAPTQHCRAPVTAMSLLPSPLKQLFTQQILTLRVA